MQRTILRASCIGCLETREYKVGKHIRMYIKKRHLLDSRGLTLKSKCNNED